MAMMWGHDWGWGWGAWLVMSLLMAMFWGLVIAGIVVLVRSLGSRQPGGSAPETRQPSAEELLAERFARGEIDGDEYTRRRELLRAGR